MAETDLKDLYYQRLNYEIDVINQMGFASYFLIVADFISWAKKNGIPVGPGRGSGAGSLVAYALKITDLDPIKHDLLFERFLNPERVSLPDFDIDFCMDGRDRVIEYVVNRYGKEKVAQIITYGTMAARAVVRDVGRVLGYPYGFVDKLAKLIPFELGITLEKALAEEDLLAARYNEEEEVKTLIDLAMKLEGITRNAGKHAGGVVIAPSFLTDFMPLYCESDDSTVVTQFDKYDVENIGLVKFDFLGLRTLTIIDWALRAIKEKLDITQIPLDDPETYKLLHDCNTTAVFQLESRGMKDLVKRLQPDCFDDIVALVALFRPGPLQSGMVDDFVNRKHKRAAVNYLHPKLEPILRNTYGVIVYQEQVMQIAQSLAGFSLGSADLLRRAMGKKKPEEMAQQRAIFLEGAAKNNINQQLANTIFDLMEKFAGYGFNKSHSAAYALLTYQTAWLKVHYPAEFMAAVLSSDMDNTDKVVLLLNDSKNLGLKIIVPDINSSNYKFIVTGPMQILYGLGAIKGVGAAAIENIIQNRNSDGSFTSLFDFCQRVDTKKANRRVLEALICAGAFDKIGPNRATLLGSIDIALQTADQRAFSKNTGQIDLFSLMDEVELEVEPLKYLEVKDWADEERLKREKSVLGFYLEGHPMERFHKDLVDIVSGTIAEVAQENQKSIKIAGFIAAIRILNTKSGNRFAIVTLEDQTGKIDITIFSDLFAVSRHLLNEDQLVVIEGEIEIDSFTDGKRIRASNILTLEAAREKCTNALWIKFKMDNLFSTNLNSLHAILKNYCGGNTPVFIAYQNNGATAKLALGKEWKVFLRNQLLLELRQTFGEENIKCLR